jgi:hypothetical protein
MKFLPGRSRQTELPDAEKMALRGIAQGGPIALALCRRLQKLGLAEKGHGGWAITPQGHITLMLQGAHRAETWILLGPVIN